MEDTLKTLHLRTLHAPRLAFKVVGDLGLTATVLKFCWAFSQEKLNVHVASEYRALNCYVCFNLHQHVQSSCFQSPFQYNLEQLLCALTEEAQAVCFLFNLSLCNNIFCLITFMLLSKKLSLFFFFLHSLLSFHYFIWRIQLKFLGCHTCNLTKMGKSPNMFQDVTFIFTSNDDLCHRHDPILQVNVYRCDSIS